MAIVTSSSLRTADAHLRLAGIRHRFETLLTRDDVVPRQTEPRSLSPGGGKVQPEAGGLRRGRGFNDGVTAAHAAGAITIMVPDMVTPTDELRARCAAVLSDLHEVTEMLRTRGRFERRF